MPFGVPFFYANKWNKSIACLAAFTSWTLNILAPFWRENKCKAVVAGKDSSIEISSGLYIIDLRESPTKIGAFKNENELSCFNKV